MGSTLESLTPALASNAKARDLARKLDNKNAVAKTLKNQLEEVGDRPSRVKRAMSALSGAGMAGVATGLVRDRRAKAAIGIGAGIIGVVVGAVIDSDIVFDAAIGAGCVGAGMATDATTEAGVDKLKAMAASATATPDAAAQAA